MIYSVNDVVAGLDRLHGETIRIAGRLVIEFEGNSIWHIPKSEQLSADFGYGSSLWALFDCEAIGQTLEELKEFNGRHVVVSATIDREFRGHFSMWPGSAVIRAISKRKSG